MLYKELCHKILGCAFEVHKGLGPGLLEQCYHNRLFYELKSKGLAVEYNAPFTVSYKKQVVGEYLADLVVDGTVILELKSVKTLADAHKAQLINYLRISGCSSGVSA